MDGSIFANRDLKFIEMQGKHFCLTVLLSQFLLSILKNTIKIDPSNCLSRVDAPKRWKMPKNEKEITFKTKFRNDALASYPQPLALLYF